MSGFVNEGVGLLEKSLRRLPPRIVFDGQGDANGGLGNRITLRMDSVNLSKPLVNERTKGVRERRVFPTEARESSSPIPESSPLVSVGASTVIPSRATSLRWATALSSSDPTDATSAACRQESS